MSNMKTQLFRVKQLAAQRVGRAEKTDLLTEDLQMVEKTVDKVKVACTTASKKLNACMLSNGADVEKRKKKLPQLLLGQGMVESAALLGEKSLLGGIMLKAGEAQSAIAGEVATCETEMDGQVLAPLHELTEVQIPNIHSTKKKLSVARLDMDSAKTRWQNALKVSNKASGNKLESVAQAELLKGEFEDQSILFQQLQDQLATEMLTFVAGERTYAHWTVKMLEAQLRQHEAAVQILKECLPQVEKQMEDAMFRPTFGCPLDVHLRIKERDIALVLEECILFLLDTALNTQGLFRLPGSASKIKKLKAYLNIGYADLEEYEHDIHVVTGVLKLYLRELPEPLMTYELYDEWINASKIKEGESRLHRLKELVDLLPKANKDNLRYLVCFLSKLSLNAEVNKMSPSNIAIVIGPNVLWSPDDGGYIYFVHYLNIEAYMFRVNLKTTGNVCIILESLIENCTVIFPEGCDFTRHVSTDDHDSRFYNPKDADNLSPDATTTATHGGGGGGNIFSDMKTKFHWKEGSSEKKGVSNVGVQGFYNPVAAKMDTNTDVAGSEDAPPGAVVKKAPIPIPPPPHDSSHKRNPSTGSTSSQHRRTPSDATSQIDQSQSGHQRSTSVGTNDVTEQCEVKKPPPPLPPGRGEIPRRPAPPVPKYPPTGPPKSKPPEPPKTKPPDPPPGPSIESGDGGPAGSNV